MERTTPVSNGWMTLVRPLGTIFPVADATMSIVPNQAQTSAAQNSRMMVAPIARPIGDGGVSTISSAAGRNASSSPRRSCARRNGTTRRGLTGLASSADFMNSCLQPMQRCIAAASLDQRVMGAVLDQAAALERGDALALAAREGRAALADDRVVTFGQLEDKFVGSREPRRCDDTLHRDGGV